MSIRYRILILALIGLAGMLAASALLLLDKNETARKMNSLHELGELAPLVSSVVHELQRERGVSAGYLGSHGGKFTVEIETQRELTDQHRAALRSVLARFSTTDFGAEMETKIRVATGALAQLSKIRDRIGELELSVDQMVEFYSGSIAKLLLIVEHLASLSTNAEVARAVAVYTSFLHLKEFAGQERALGTQGFSQNKFTPAAHVRVTQLIAVQSAYSSEFLRNATRAQVEFYRETLAGPVVAEIERMREIAVLGGAGGRLVKGDPLRWYAETTKRINLLKIVEDRIASDFFALTEGIQKTARSAFVRLVLVVAPFAIGIAAMAIFFGNIIIQPLRNMTEVMVELAAGENAVEVPALERHDEIGKMARAVEVFKENAIKKLHLEEEEQKEIAKRTILEFQLQKQADELKRTNAELERFVYVAAHDLKAPMRGIDNLATWIEEDLEGELNEETEENLTLLRGRVQRMESLLDSLLEYSRIGRTEIKAETVDTRELVTDVVDYLVLPNGFNLEMHDPMPILSTHRTSLEQVFRNLIGNAVKHHDRPEGRITISASNNGDLAEFSVSDDGPGIPPEFHERIFAMFQTLKPRDEVEGSGMGLALVQKEVERHNGSVRIDSDAGARGASFHFTWKGYSRTDEESWQPNR